MVTIAPAITAPEVSCTTPEIVPVFTCENRERENSNMPRVALSAHTHFPPRAIFHVTGFMNTLLFGSRRQKKTYVSTLGRAYEYHSDFERASGFGWGLSL